MKDVPSWVDEVLSFWFGRLGPADWFKRSDAVDTKIRASFLAVWEAARLGVPSQAVTNPRWSLASVLVLDQFPRNMFRGAPLAFATDPLARAVTSAALDAGIDAQMGLRERQFLYLPFMHSEFRADQLRSVELFSKLGLPHTLAFAVAHRDVIERFGRFPHRNAVLGRADTAEEAAFLKDNPGW